MKMVNVLQQALKPNRILVMTKKLLTRLTDQPGLLSKQENLDWIKSNSSSFAELATKLDADLWREAEQVSKAIELHAEKRLRNIEYELGGGGMHPFLYFITRYINPQYILETGVAAGYSSYAFLAAINKNGRGRLYSSDFPYFRLPNPERFIGIIVDESLKNNWELYIDGDEINLPKVMSVVPHVDLFHYDSDKSYAGRKFAMTIIDGKMSKCGIIFMDDIQDNSFFHDYVTQRQTPAWSIFEYCGKYVGMLGTLTRLK